MTGRCCRSRPKGPGLEGHVRNRDRYQPQSERAQLCRYRACRRTSGRRDYRAPRSAFWKLDFAGHGWSVECSSRAISLRELTRVRMAREPFTVTSQGRSWLPTPRRAIGQSAGRRFTSSLCTGLHWPLASDRERFTSRRRSDDPQSELQLLDVNEVAVLLV